MTLQRNTFVDKHWLAGLIDGDGYFGLSKAGYPCLEVTSSSQDAFMFKNLQACYGGSVKPRAGTASIRWRLTKTMDLTYVLKLVNGKLRNDIRKSQFAVVAQKLNLKVLPSENFSWNNGYFAGLFDSDGKITLSIKSHNAKHNLKGTQGKMARLCAANQTQLTIGVTQKYARNLAFLKNADFGHTVYDRNQNGYTTWYVSSKKDVCFILDYFKVHPSQSVRSHRLALVPKLYTNIRQNPRLWVEFVQSWFKHKVQSEL